MSDGKTNESVEGLVLAAGLGTGVGEGPKAFLRLKGRSLLRMTVDGLLPHVDRVIVAVPPSHMAEALAEVGDVATVIEGGETRQDSVERVVDASAAPVLLLSEVCRPLFSGELVRKVRDLAPVHGVAVPFVAPHFPIALRDGESSSQSLEPEQVLLPQFPQGYTRALMLQACEHGRRDGIWRRSTWQLLQETGVPIWVVEGEARNIKITTLWIGKSRSIWPNEQTIERVDASGLSAREWIELHIWYPNDGFPSSPVRRAMRRDAGPSQASHNAAGDLGKLPSGSRIPASRGVDGPCRCFGIACEPSPAEKPGYGIE